MTILKSLSTPMSVAFLTIALGYLIGKIKIFKVSLDLSGVLITAVAAGYFISASGSLFEPQTVIETNSLMSILSPLGTSLFVSAIGVAAGYSFNLKKLDEFKAFITGAFMSAASFMAMKIIFMLDKHISYSELLGAFCGAMTTTPGLSTVCEIGKISEKSAVLGYGRTYVFGVVFTVMFVQICLKKRNSDTVSDACEIKKEVQSSSFDGILQIAFSIVLGRILGRIKFFGGLFSLGNSGGILFAGIFTGIIIKKLLPKASADSNFLNTIRNLGLVLFFVGTGIPAGMELTKGSETVILIYGMILTVVPIAIGMVLSKIFFKSCGCVLPALMISGGMTSTPAVAIISKKISGRLPLSKYSTSYSGSLITTIILLRILT